MSFRSRLTTFFILIVIVPMVGVGFLVFRLISDSQQAKVDARASGLSTSAQSYYLSQRTAASVDAREIARNAALAPGPQLDAQLRLLLVRLPLARIELIRGGSVIADVGSPDAIAPGEAEIASSTGLPIRVYVSSVTASQFQNDLVGAGEGMVIRAGGKTLSSTPAAAARFRFPGRGTRTIAGTRYRFVTTSVAGFPGTGIAVTVLSNVNAGGSSPTTTRFVAAVFIAGFLLLAFGFSILASRALEGQLSRFLQAARRLAGGDFSAPVPIEGSDEFAALGVEFNNMSSELRRKLEELSEERGRLRQSIRRIGATFASNLDPQALLELALRTSLDAVHADRGRLTVREHAAGALVEALRVGSVTGGERQFLDAERQALQTGRLGEAAGDGVYVAAITVGPSSEAGPPGAVITVGRGEPFTDDDRDLLRSLGSQATLALENVQLHFQIQRQAVTDELTGLANHGRFQELLSAEIEQVRRYRHPVALIMIDIDKFKGVNDTYGHPQGDVVLKEVANVLRDNSRDADAPARYGGEELALILPHTDLEGAYAIAERVRTAIESLRIQRLDGGDPLRVTASLGVASVTGGDKASLIAEADAALYSAKRGGRNRTVRAPIVAAEIRSADTLTHDGTA